MTTGSHGPAVVPLLAFLTGWMYDAPSMVESLDLTGDVFGERAAHILKIYQYQEGLSEGLDESVGVLTAEVRRYMKEVHSFDYDAFVRLLPGMTVFVQRDGSEIVWSPEIEAAAERADVAGVVHQTR